MGLIFCTALFKRKLFTPLSYVLTYWTPLYYTLEINNVPSINFCILFFSLVYCILYFWLIIKIHKHKHLFHIHLGYCYDIVTCLQVILTPTCRVSGYPRQVIEVDAA
jgi:hypothetical protein